MSYIEQDQANQKRSKALYELTRQSGSNFINLHQSALSEGIISTKTKDLMALAIAISKRCEGCILSHVKDAVKNGATIEEIGETVEVAILMNGGPAIVYGGKAIEAAKEFIDGLA